MGRAASMQVLLNVNRNNLALQVRQISIYRLGKILSQVAVFKKVLK